MSKKSRRPFMKVKENLEIEEQLQLLRLFYITYLVIFDHLHQLLTELMLTTWGN